MVWYAMAGALAPCAQGSRVNARAVAREALKTQSPKSRQALLALMVLLLVLARLGVDTLSPWVAARRESMARSAAEATRSLACAGAQAPLTHAPFHSTVNACTMWDR
jgi:hypothetical protein